MTETDERMLPLYEAKMVDQYDHRDADVVKSPTAGKRQNQPQYLTESEHWDPSRMPQPSVWIAESDLPDDAPSWLTGFADVTSTTNERTVLASALPRSAVANTYPIIDASDRACLVALLNSFVLDYVARQKVPALHLNFRYVMQFPVPPPEELEEPMVVWGGALRDWTHSRVLELQWNAYDMVSFAADLGDTGEPFVWDSERRARLRVELDAAFFHLYGIGRQDVDYILETFGGVRKKDLKAHGEYRTRRLILEVFDAMQRAIDTGTEYETILDPPPGQGARHGRTAGADS
ncbi:hypothetical protein GCM10027059_22360 [Myceligenerans halotolerans]